MAKKKMYKKHTSQLRSEFKKRFPFNLRIPIVPRIIRRSRSNGSVKLRCSMAVNKAQSQIFNLTRAKLGDGNLRIDNYSIYLSVHF